MLAALVFGVVPFGPAAAELISVQGDEPVLVQIDFGAAQVRTAGSDQWTPAADGQVLQAGSEISTGPASRITLVFFDGSVMQIEHDTRVTIVESKRAATGSTQIVTYVGFGNVWSRVNALLDAGSVYAVTTPAGVGLVRGTQFKVTVHPDGSMDLKTVEGVVEVGKDTAATPVRVEGGKETSLGRSPDAKPAEPKDFEPTEADREEIESLRSKQDRGAGNQKHAAPECPPDAGPDCKDGQRPGENGKDASASDDKGNKESDAQPTAGSQDEQAKDSHRGGNGNGNSGGQGSGHGKGKP